MHASVDAALESQEVACKAADHQKDKPVRRDWRIGPEQEEKYNEAQDARSEAYQASQYADHARRRQPENRIIKLVEFRIVVERYMLVALIASYYV